MKKYTAAIFIAMLIPAMMLTVSAKEYLFKLRDDAAILCDDEASLMTEECFSEENAIAIDHGIFKTDDLSIIQKYTDLGLVEYYEEDAPAYLFDMPNTSEYMTIASGVSSSTIPLGRSYNQLNIQALWSLGFTGKGVVVGVIDSGAYPNEDIADNLLPGENVSPDLDSDPSKQYVTTDGNGHGTMVAGLIATNGNNYRGVAYEAKIVPFKAFTDSGSGMVSNMVKGMYKAVDEYGCDIINMSCGAKKDELKTLLEATNYAVSKGVPVIVAAGNGGGSSNTVGGDADYYPASYDAAISVANITVDDTHWNSSQENNGVDISAPGRMIYGLLNQNTGYRYNNGTSFSCPIVTGVASLILGYKPNITPSELKKLICDTATDLGTEGWDMSYGHGKVNCAAIVPVLLDGKFYRSPIVKYKNTCNVAIRNGLDSTYSSKLIFSNYTGNKMTAISLKDVTLANGESTTFSIASSGSMSKFFELDRYTFNPIGSALTK